MIYKPIKDGIERDSKFVTYVEVEPPIELQKYIHCFWELKTKAPLYDDFHYHIIPDACVNILFNQKSTNITAITALNKTAKTLNLGKEFHYIGIQLLPGVWQGDPQEIKDDLVDKPYLGNLELVQINNKLINLSFTEQQKIMSKAIQTLIEQELVVFNPLITKILSELENINSVADMAKLVNITTRQLQRKLKEMTGFSPHDFLKILRLQHSFRNDYLAYYSDQSHFIHSFRAIIGYTPDRFSKKFNV